MAYWVLGRIYRKIGKDHEAVKLFTTVLELNPEFYTVYADLRMVYEKLGDEQRKEEVLQASLRMLPRYMQKNPDDARARMFHAQDLAIDGKKEEGKAEAAKALDLSPGDAVMLYNAACFYSSLGEKKATLDTLKKAIIAGWVDYEWIAKDPDFDPIRNEPEYIELMKGK
jgi:tetratricopeptide (TPR) repeat protein